MAKCQKCGENVQTGFYTYDDKFVCRDCRPLYNFLHVDEYEITENGVQKISTPKDEKEERYELIQLIHKIFPAPNKSVYSLINQYIKKGYTILGMIRALEYFYIVRKNSNAKSKNNIGIIPYVYEEAQNYFHYLSQQEFKKYLSFWEESKKEIVITEVILQDKTKKPQIDMNIL